MTRKQMNAEIKRIEPNVGRGTEDFLAYQVLLAGAIVGPKQQDILKFLKTDRWPKAIEFIERAKRQRIFVGEKIDSEIYSDGVGLALGVNVLMGYIRRSRVSTTA